MKPKKLRKPSVAPRGTKHGAEQSNQASDLDLFDIRGVYPWYYAEELEQFIAGKGQPDESAEPTSVNPFYRPLLP